MKRVFLFTSLLAHAAVANGCTRERIVVVHEPSTDKNAVSGDGTPIATDDRQGEQPPHYFVPHKPGRI